MWGRGSRCRRAVWSGGRCDRRRRCRRGRPPGRRCRSRCPRRSRRIRATRRSRRGTGPFRCRGPARRSRRGRSAWGSPVPWRRAVASETWRPLRRRRGRRCPTRNPARSPRRRRVLPPPTRRGDPVATPPYGTRACVLSWHGRVNPHEGVANDDQWSGVRIPREYAPVNRLLPSSPSGGAHCENGPFRMLIEWKSNEIRTHVDDFADDRICRPGTRSPISGNLAHRSLSSRAW